MRIFLSALLILTLLIPIPGSAAELDLSAPTSTSPPSAAPELSGAPLLDAPPMTLNCASAMLIEPESGQIIFEMNAHSQRPVASITKVMTILLTLEAIEAGRISLDDMITISPDAAGMGGSQVLLDVGETQTIAVLLKSMIVGSANDAAVALAEALYGSEELCVDQMNARARALGMADTLFVNCTGLPADGQRTTARDVAIMSAAMFNHSLYYDFSKTWLDEIDHGDGRVTQLTNTNKLIRLYDGCDGGKTGSTNEAGYCITATAERGGMRLIAVVLGAPSGTERFDTAKEMFDYGFANYRLYPVAQRGTPIRGRLPVTSGDADSVALELNGDLTLLVLKGSEQNIQLVPNLPESVEAPIPIGQQIGWVNVIVEGKNAASIPVVASESVGAKGFRHGLKRFWEQWLVKF